MYQNFASEMKGGFKPLMNIFDIQNRTAQKILREQTDFLGDCLEVGTRRAETLRGSQEATDFFRVPVDTSRDLGERWINAAGRQWNILMEARNELTGEIKTATQDVESASNEAAAEASSAAGKSVQKTESTAKKADTTTSKS